MKAINFYFSKKWFFEENLPEAQLVLFFGAKSLLNTSYFKEVRSRFPKAHIVSCSTAGEIIGQEVYDGTITGTAIFFEKTEIKISFKNIRNFDNSFELGKAVSDDFKKEKLKHLFIVSDGHIINGSRLLEGISLDHHDVIITGGLAGDGSSFESTLVGYNNSIANGNVVTIGYYSESLQVGHASLGGWDEFGPERFITKSKENVLYELDDEPALELYKKYLGDKARELPSSALLFPLSLKQDDHSAESIVRTVLSIDNLNNSMTFAGNLPENKIVRLMKANFEKLIMASAEAAKMSIKNLKNQESDLVIYVSCIGRKLILDQRISEEVQEAQKIIGEDVPSVGFYSYGEISPYNDALQSPLHNQTMTITTYKEI